MQRKSVICLGLSHAGCVAALLTAQAPSASAQTAVLHNLPASTMATLARHVVENNPDIMAQREQVRVIKARVQAAEAGYLPTIEANGLVQKREIDVKNGGPGDSRFVAGAASVEARVRFYDGDRTYNAIKVAQAELQAAEASLDAKISDVLLELLTSAADVHLNRKIKQYSQMQSDAIGEQLRSTSRRLEFGESTRTDENLAKARLATSQAGILSATEALNIDGYRFRAVSGQSATIVPPLPPLAAMPGSLMEAQNIASEANPRLRAAQSNAKAGRSGVNFAAGALLPQVDAVGGYEYLTGGVANLFTGKLPDDRSAIYGGIELRVPIFIPRDYAEIRRARAVRDQRLALTDFAERTLAEEVASSWTQWQSAKSTIVTAQEAVAAIEQAAEGLKKEAVGGNRTLVEVLDAQNELLAARVTLERAIRNEFVARAGVLAAIGGLDSEDVLEGGALYNANDSLRPSNSPLGAKFNLPANSRSGAAVTSLQSVAGSSDTATGQELAATVKPRNPNRPEVSALGRKVNNANGGSITMLTENK